MLVIHFNFREFNFVGMFIEVSKSKTLQKLPTIWSGNDFVLLTLSSFSNVHLNVYDHTTLKAPVLI